MHIHAHTPHTHTHAHAHTHTHTYTREHRPTCGVVGACVEEEAASVGRGLHVVEEPLEVQPSGLRVVVAVLLDLQT